MNDLTIKINSEEVVGQMKALSASVQAKILKVAFNEGLAKVKRKAKSKARKHLGNLKKWIVAKVQIYKGAIWGGVGIKKDWINTGKVFTRGKRKGKAKYAAPAKYAHLVHSGFTHKRSGKKVSGDHFLYNAFKTEEMPMVATITAELKRMIDKAIATGAVKGSQLKKR